MKVSSFFVIILLFFSCSPQKAAEQKAKEAAAATSSVSSAAGSASVSYTLEVIPASADRTATLTAIPHGFVSSGGNIEWLVNDVPTLKGQTFSTKDAFRGDNVKAKAVVKGLGVFSNVVQINNTPPQMMKVKLMPEVFRPGDTFYVDAEAKDMDGDSVTILYEWTKNGEPAGNEKTIEGLLKRGDTVFVKITPFDGESYGDPITLTRQFQNLPPEIIGHTKSNFDGRHWSYQVKASDPDGDALSYALKEGPKGMTIDPDTGLITWDVPDDFVGKTSFTVTANDGHGGEASYTAKVTIKNAGTK